MAEFKPLPPFGEQHKADSNYPITPPPELLQQLRLQAPKYRDCGVRRDEWIATQAFHWGWEKRGAVNEAKLQKARDEELKACEEWLRDIRNHGLFDYDIGGMLADRLRAARRPKPPSQAEEALESLGHLEKGAESQMDTTEAVCNIRSALKRLQEHEQQFMEQVND